MDERPPRDSAGILESTREALRRAESDDFEGVLGAAERADRLRRDLLDGIIWQPLF